MIAVGISSSDDDSLATDQRLPGLSLELYRSLELTTALSQPENYVRAVQELAAVVEALPRFGRPGRKATASEMMNDALLAVNSCNGWLGCLSALARLVAACNKQPLLPQQRVRRLTREHKRIAVTFARQKGDCSIPRGRFLDLPQACLVQVLSFLNPLSLAKCACVCREWREAVSSPEALSLFDRHYQYYFPDPYRQWRQTRGYTYTLADGAKRGVEQGAWGLDARAAFKHTYTHMLERGCIWAAESIRHNRVCDPAGGVRWTRQDVPKLEALLPYGFVGVSCAEVVSYLLHASGMSATSLDTDSD